MNDLLKFTIDAHGGLEAWNRFEKITARIFCGGSLWERKQQGGVLDDIYVTSDTKREFTSHYPFINKNWHTSFEPGRVAIENEKNEVVEELFNPRKSFEGYDIKAPWTRLQLAYFAGYAMWTYFNAPFSFAAPGFEVKELDPWEEDGEIFRRLQVIFPDNIASHSKVQTFYVDKSGLIMRHDYNVDISGGVNSAHYLSDYTEVQGIKIATSRAVYARKEDNTSVRPEPLLVSVRLSEIKLS